MRKKSITILFCLLLLSAFVLFADASQTGINTLSACWTTDATQLCVHWSQVEEQFYLFIPGDIEPADIRLQIDASDDVFYNNIRLTEETTLAELPFGEAFEITCADNTYSLTCLQGSSIPSLHITTESGSMDAVHADKSHKEPAEIVILSGGTVELTKDLDYIKGRGNATWALDKKPYNIKFNKKTDLFGMGKAKKWSLLANHLDKSLLRNRVALDLAESMGISYTSKNCFIDLYVNNEYYGNYLLCESVEVGETRVDIFDLEGATEDANEGIDLDELPLGGNHTKSYTTLTSASQKWVSIPNNPEDISGGYLLETEILFRYIDEVSGFVTSHRQGVVLKSPEYASEAQVKYISSLYQDFEDAVYSETGYNTKGKHYSEYIDMDSFVKMYVFQEFVKNFDAGITSFYLYKDAGDDKFYAAPVWDFDNALGKSNSRYGLQLSAADEWWANCIYYDWAPQQYVPTILNLLYRHDDFYALAAAEWNENLSQILSAEKMQYFADESARIRNSAMMNAVYWDLFEKETPAQTADAFSNYCKNNLFSFMTNRKAFMDKGFSATAVRVFYDANGGTGAVFNAKALQLGDVLTLPSEGITNGDLYFAGWNTRSDGSGNVYPPGTKVTLRQNAVTLYAQWVENEEDIYTQIENKNLLFIAKRVIEQFIEECKEILQFFKYI